MRTLISRSIEEKFPLEIIYLSEQGKISQRKILVQEMNSNTLRAYCFLRKQTRLFKLENILSVKSLQKKEPNIS